MTARKPAILRRYGLHEPAESIGLAAFRGNRPTGVGERTRFNRSGGA